jgi:hypothetical protein
MMALSPGKSPNPFLQADEAPRAHPALAPPPAADVPPLVSIDQITPAIQASPTVTRPSKAPGAVSLMPSLFVKSAARRRRGIIVVTSVVLLFVVGIVAVMVFSRMH